MIYLGVYLLAGVCFLLFLFICDFVVKKICESYDYYEHKKKMLRFYRFAKSIMIGEKGYGVMIFSWCCFILCWIFIVISVLAKVLKSDFR